MSKSDSPAMNKRNFIVKKRDAATTKKKKYAVKERDVAKKNEVVAKTRKLNGGVHNDSRGREKEEVGPSRKKEEEKKDRGAHIVILKEM
ncbi:unnamed protein product [Brassica rapa subsp. narinosa]